jgi:SAM-dependent methyltransferase
MAHISKTRSKSPRISSSLKQKLKQKNQGIKLDIGCGANKTGDDWVGIDYRQLPGVDVVHDLTVFPWPIPSECASLGLASHVVEHISPINGTFIKFMDEVWRVLKPGGQFLISGPYGVSNYFVQDPTHCNPCNETTWTYFDPEAETGLYNIYEPKPWKILKNFYQSPGFFEVALEKRAE